MNPQVGRAKLISVTEAAERIGCSRGHVYDLITAGKLRRYDIGLKASKTRVSDEDVERFIASAEKPAKATA